MDKETLVWIKQNRPNIFSQHDILNFKKGIAENLIECVKHYTPKQQWFFNSEQINTIHGLRHILRVIINTYNLCIGNKLNDLLTRNAMIAASLHDLGRLNDKNDSGHGFRTMEWVKQNFNLLEDHYRITLNDCDKHEIYTAIHLHELPYDCFLNKHQKIYKKNNIIVDVIKSADALDRYRLPKLRWWIDDQYIRIVPPIKIKILAYEMVIASEKYFITGSNSQDSVIQGIHGVYDNDENR